MSNTNNQVTPADLRPYVEEVYDTSWEIHYQGAQCKFELSSVEDAVIHDLEVPEGMRNSGIGTSMAQLAENIVRERTQAEVLYAQIGASGGATKHVLSEKCGFKISGVDDRYEIGQVVDAVKQLD